MSQYGAAAAHWAVPEAAAQQAQQAYQQKAVGMAYPPGAGVLSQLTTPATPEPEVVIPKANPILNMEDRVLVTRTADEETEDGRVRNKEAMTKIRDAWVYKQIRNRVAEFTEFKQALCFCGTWNVGAKSKDVEALDEWICSDWGADGRYAPDIVAVGFQEIVDLNAVNVAVDNKTQQKAQFWTDRLRATLNQRMHPNSSTSSGYALVMQRSMVGLLVCVFVKTPHRDRVKYISSDSVGVGVMGMMGNKGGVSIRIQFYDSTICFVCSHLAAHRENVAGRNADFVNVLSKLSFDVGETAVRETIRNGSMSQWASGSSSVGIADHDAVFWLGDLNYRIDESLPTEKVLHMAEANQIKELSAMDQLNIERREGRVFQGFQEGDIAFPPTYKYQPGTNVYEQRPEKKLRAPAWCDRILWLARDVQHVQQLTYKRSETPRISDHKPVFSTFRVTVKDVIVAKREAIYEQLMGLLDRYENQAQPMVGLDRNELDFGPIRYQQSVTLPLTISNTGNVCALYRFVPKLDENTLCKPWMTISPTYGMLIPGEQPATVNITITIDNETAHLLNAQREVLNDILVLRLENGRDYYITVNASYARSCFGMTLDELVLYKEPIRNVRLDAVDRAEQFPGDEASPKNALCIPKELWRIVDAIYEKGLQQPELFTAPGDPEEMKQIRESLDTGRPFGQFSVHSYVATFLEFLDSLAVPVVPVHMFPSVEINAENIQALSRRFLEELPPIHYNVFVLQSKRLLGHQTCRLSPSMDLVVLAPSGTLLRTVSWETLAVLPLREDVPVVLEWSPNGRWMALAQDTTLSLYDVEQLANPPGGSSSMVPEPPHSWTLSEPVVALKWAHVGHSHPDFAPAADDEEDDTELVWSYQSYYVDKATNMLPPSGYIFPSEEEEEMPSEHPPASAKCQTPLSVLCVVTTHSIHMYLHGRYPLLTWKRLQEDLQYTPNIAFSNDLSYVLFQTPSKVSMYSLPFFHTDRFPLQVVASLHASIMGHLQSLQKSVKEITNTWRAALKPLDNKLQPLVRLLHNYGVDDQPLGAILKQFILVGHTSDSNVANAIDQYCTSVQLNDQLLQQMNRGLRGALANVEKMARKGLLSPTQALSWHVHELAGQIQLYQVHGSEESLVLQQLVDSCHRLWMSVEALLIAMVDARFRVRDFGDWLRNVGSQVKARGTASDSVQRENAKNRRVSQAVLEQLLKSLNVSAKAPSGPASSEHLLSLSVMDPKQWVSLSSSTTGARPGSPSSVSQLEVGPTPTVAHAIEQAVMAAQNVFEDPLSNIPADMTPLEPTDVVAIHTRIGADGDTNNSPVLDENDTNPSFFAPRISPQGKVAHCRHWALTARARMHEVQLFAFPLASSSDDESASRASLPYYLTAKCVLPGGSTVRDAGFYGDDGKSALSSGEDSGTGKESRQKFGCLVERDSQLELWVAPYHSINWQTYPASSKLVDSWQVSPDCTTTLIPVTGGDEDMETELAPSEGYAQVRTIGTLESEPVRLYLCGSRGVGLTAITSEKFTTIEVLDLEEDDDDEEEEDDDFEEDL
eukprot:Nitzschia sp. Nitz4//scaffold85_size83877//58734//64309//NITZ4_005237-RA/size83877-processed-gene-0.128-mRNA-1//1//CDS//3329559161//2808//frame0